MEPVRDRPRPIGWWLKEADAALDAAFDAALAGRDVDRRGWQILASLSRGPLGAPDLLASLASFDQPATLVAALESARSRGWVVETDGLLRLTPDGAAAHDVLAAQVEQVRGQVAGALPPDDYALLVDLLRRLVEGLRPRP